MVWRSHVGSHTTASQKEYVSQPDKVVSLTGIGGPFKDRKFGVNRSGYFASRNTGKKSVVLDLKSDEGKRLVFDIIRKADGKPETEFGLDIALPVAGLNGQLSWLHMQKHPRLRSRGCFEFQR